MNIGNEYPDKYKIKIQLGYTSIILFFLSVVLFKVFNKTIWVIIPILLIVSAFFLYFYSFICLNDGIRRYSKIKIHNLIITGSFTVFILLFAFLTH